MGRPDFSFSLCTNDIQHSCPIRPFDQQLTPPLPSSKSSLLEMPSPRTGVDDGAFFKAARRTAIECGLFSGGDFGEAGSKIPYVIEMSSSFEVLPRLIKVAKKRIFYVKRRHNPEKNKVIGAKKKKKKKKK